MTQTDNSKSALEISTILAKNASETKDWRIRDKRSRAFKALATELINSGKTLIEATPHELAEQFPRLYSYDGPIDNQKYTWGIFPKYKGSYVKFFLGAIE